jgi:hypothetical protein
MPRDPPVISATRPLSENRSWVFMGIPWQCLGLFAAPF